MEPESVSFSAVETRLAPSRGAPRIGAAGVIEASGAAQRSEPVDRSRFAFHPARWMVGLLRSVPLPHVGVLFLLTGTLYLLPGRTSIPPLIQSDYTYLLTAADRFVAGDGLTTPPPVAPLQDWDWRADWTFLTKWPCGYPLLIALVRGVSGASTIQACGIISVLACAGALVGWFALARKCAPRGINAVLLALVAAGCAVSTASLINPSTDAIIMALIPPVVLLTLQGMAPAKRHATAVDSAPEASGAARKNSSLGCLAMAGLLAGSCFWIRYASIFVPMGIGAFLLIRSIRHKSPGMKAGLVFGAMAAAPIAALLLLNRAMGAGASASEQLNLGGKMGFDLTPEHLSTAWWKLTEFGFYAHHRLSHLVFATWPALLLVAAGMNRPVRASLARFVGQPAIGLCASVLAALVIMLIAATTLFGAKFEYVSLDRYYLAAKPIYFLLFIAPLLAVRWRTSRVAIGLVLVVLISWQIRQEWPRPYQRWLQAGREVTPYGQWANCFSPGAASTYLEVAQRTDDRTIVISNFHEWIVLETRIPALPVPPNKEALDRWIDAVCLDRGIQDPRILFVLDRNTRWRSYWIEPFKKIVDRFSLTPLSPAPNLSGTELLAYRR